MCNFNGNGQVKALVKNSNAEPISATGGATSTGAELFKEEQTKPKSDPVSALVAGHKDSLQGGSHGVGEGQHLKVFKLPILVT